MHGTHDEVGTTHVVAAGEDLRMAGLERQPVRTAGADAATGIQFDAVLGAPCRRAGAEAERLDHHVGAQFGFAALDVLQPRAAMRVGTHLGMNQAHAAHLALLAKQGERLAMEQEVHAFLAAVADLAARTGHAGLVAAVHAGDRGGAEAHRGAVAIHAGVAAAEHDDVLAVEVERGRHRLVVEQAVRVGDQERQRVVYAVEFAPGQLAVDEGVGTGAEEDRVIVRQQPFERDVAADLHVEMEAHAHAFEYLAPGVDHRLVQLERRNAEGEQAADLALAVEHVHRDAGTAQPVRAGQACRAGTDHRHAAAGFHHAGQIRPPALAERLVGDRTLDAADRHRAEAALLQRAGAFAQAILRTHAAADFRQRVGFVHQGGGFEQTSILHQLQPVRDVVVHRTGVFAIRIAAVEAALGLAHRRGWREVAADLAVAEHADRHRHRLRRLARQVEELKKFVAHGMTPEVREEE